MRVPIGRERHVKTIRQLKNGSKHSVLIPGRECPNQDSTGWGALAWNIYETNCLLAHTPPLKFTFVLSVWNKCPIPE